MIGPPQLIINRHLIKRSQLPLMYFRGSKGTPYTLLAMLYPQIPGLSTSLKSKEVMLFNPDHFKTLGFVHFHAYSVKKAAI